MNSSQSPFWKSKLSIRIMLSRAKENLHGTRIPSMSYAMPLSRSTEAVVLGRLPNTGAKLQCHLIFSHAVAQHRVECLHRKCWTAFIRFYLDVFFLTKIKIKETVTLKLFLFLGSQAVNGATIRLQNFCSVNQENYPPLFPLVSTLSGKI